MNNVRKRTPNTWNNMCKATGMGKAWGACSRWRRALRLEAGVRWRAAGDDAEEDVQKQSGNGLRS